MAFRFSLETLLKFRHSKERSERLKLEVIASEQSRIRTALRDLEDMSRESYGRFQQRLGGGLTGAELQLEVLREANINLACAGLRAGLVDCEQRRRQQVQVFFQARRNREILDELCLRQLQDYRLKQARREQQGFDDLFLMRREPRQGE